MFYTICISSLPLLSRPPAGGHLSASVSVLVCDSLFCPSWVFCSGGLPAVGRVYPGALSFTRRGAACCAPIAQAQKFSTQSVSASFLLLCHQPIHPYRATGTAFQLDRCRDQKRSSLGQILQIRQILQLKSVRPQHQMMHRKIL